MNTNVKLVTDGACSGNPGPGGWCALLSVPSKELVLRGYCLKTTNNAMELQAVLAGLRALKCPCHVEIVSDSKYVVEGINTWVSGWKRNGWRNAEKRPVANRDLWEPIAELMCVHVVKATWVAGHAVHVDNNRADRIAQEEASKAKITALNLALVAEES